VIESKLEQEKDANRFKIGLKPVLHWFKLHVSELRPSIVRQTTS